MIDVALFIVVVGLMVLALGVDIGALLAWLRGRWR
jgi:hypothetical protein